MYLALTESADPIADEVARLCAEHGDIVGLEQ